MTMSVLSLAWRRAAFVALGLLGSCDRFAPEDAYAINPPALPAAASPPPAGAAMALAIAPDAQMCGQAKLMLDRLVKFAQGKVSYAGTNSIVIQPQLWNALPEQARLQIMRSVASASTCPDSPSPDAEIIVREPRSQRVLARAKAGELD
jgi:hypothetical protein